MTIKLELCSDDPIVLNEMGLALTRIASVLRGDTVTPTVTGTIETVLTAGKVETVEEGPFYVLDSKNKTCGVLDTIDELKLTLSNLNFKQVSFAEYSEYTRINGMDIPLEDMVERRRCTQRYISERKYR